MSGERWREKMDKLSLFSSPLFLGFDHFERLVDSISKYQEDSYPPYNIEQIGDNGFRITLAIAGFKKTDVNISLEENKLIIRGKQEETASKNSIYIYRGIATRQFVRTFILADGVEVVNAEMDMGLLHINLIRVHNQSRVRTIEIDSSAKAAPVRSLEHKK